MRSSLWRWFSDGQYRYVVFNTLVSVIAFGRNLLFMKTLGLADLGQVALMQTIVMLVGFIQVGLINGSYILYAEHNRAQGQRIVNLMSTVIAALLVLAGVAVAFGGSGLGAPHIARETMLIGLFGGIATLASTWLNNALIADGALMRSNIVNVIAVMASLAVAVLSLPYGLLAALLSILLQPLIVGAGALLLERRLRPTRLEVDPATLRAVLVLGVMPFVGGLFILSGYQLERWSILFMLGSEALAQFYLAMMYMSFFLLIPASLMNVYFPKAMKAYQAKDIAAFNAIRRRHLYELLAYCIAAPVATVTLLPFALRQFLPHFVGGEHLVFALLPPLIVYVIRDPVTIVLYSIKDTRPVLISGVVFLATFAMAVGVSIGLGIFSLMGVIVARGIAVLSSTLYLLWMGRRALEVVK